MMDASGVKAMQKQLATINLNNLNPVYRQLLLEY